MKLTEYAAITLNEKTCLSVCRRRLCLTERGDLLETERGDLLSRIVRMQIRTLLDKQKERILAECRQKLTDTHFKPLMTEEVYEN